MKKETKRALIISGAVVVAGLTTYLLFFHKNTKKPKPVIPPADGSSPTPDSSVGKVAKVKETSANVREGSCTDTGIAVTAKGNGTIIGNVKKSQIGCQDGSGQYRWYYVVLTKELKDKSGWWGNLTEHTHGWVREDIVTLE